ncbi:MAG: VWA domain-containing protein [Defluviitaleaceae bacterium]|nr:VWA domain-containing protein [Defluviitaleaceae bacterium]
MVIKSPLNFLMLLFSFFAAIAVFFLGEVLLRFISGLPFIFQCAIYLTFVTTLCFAAIFISEKIYSGYYIPRGRVTFGGTCAKAAAIFIPCAFALGLLTQLLYGFIFTETRGDHTVVDGEVSGAMIQMIGEMEIGRRDALDLVIVVDTTGSMGSYINDVRRDISHVYDALANQTRDFRVALIDYRDFPSRTMYAGDYPAKLQLNFTSERHEIANAINALTLGNGGDIPETMYSALSMAAGLDWRPDAHKHIIVLTDAEPLDPEPYTYYTMNQIIDMLEYGDIELHLIGAGDSPVMLAFFEEISERTGNDFAHVVPVITFASFIVEQEIETWWERPHLLLAFDGSGERGGAMKIAVHALLMSLWGIFTGIAVVVFLNNSKLFTTFLIHRIIVSIVISTIFAIMMADADIITNLAARALLALGVCLLYLPTFSWGDTIAPQNRNPTAPSADSGW